MEKVAIVSIPICYFFSVGAIVAAGEQPADGSCPYKYYDIGCTPDGSPIGQGTVVGT